MWLRCEPLREEAMPTMFNVAMVEIKSNSMEQQHEQ